MRHSEVSPHSVRNATYVVQCSYIPNGMFSKSGKRQFEMHPDFWVSLYFRIFELLLSRKLSHHYTQ